MKVMTRGGENAVGAKNVDQEEEEDFVSTQLHSHASAPSYCMCILLSLFSVRCQSTAAVQELGAFVQSYAQAQFVQLPHLEDEVAAEQAVLDALRTRWNDKVCECFFLSVSVIFFFFLLCLVWFALFR